MPIPTAAALHGVLLSMTIHSDPAATVLVPHSARPCRDTRIVGVYHPAVESPAPLGLIGTHTARKAASRPHFIPVFATVRLAESQKIGIDPPEVSELMGVLGRIPRKSQNLEPTAQCALRKGRPYTVIKWLWRDGRSFSEG